ncbi:phosphoribosyltransferase [archaeon]|nr:phosphoribosyltransferase [archaeon]
MVELLKLSWEEVEEMSRAMADRAQEFEPEVVVGISRGGFIPAVLVSDELGVPQVYAVNIKRYVGVGKSLPAPLLLQKLDVSHVKSKRLLIVDDLVDKGDTMKAALQMSKNAEAAEVRTAALLCKSPSFKPDYYVRETQEWVVFPWEKRESLAWISAAAER